MKKHYIAVDLGAESGRVMLGTVSGQGLDLKEFHRFENGPIEQDGSLRWNIQSLFGHIKDGIGKVIKTSGVAIEGIAVDTWGVDFGLIGEDGEVLENPYHYRDARTDTMIDAACEKMTKRDIYQNSGIQFMQFNTIYQLLALKTFKPEVLKKTRSIAFMADLITYFLTGEIVAEYTMASTSQLMDMATGQWSKALFDAMELPKDVMPQIIQPGNVVGMLKRELADEWGCDRLAVYAVGSHDTASAVAGVPVSEPSWAYLSCGTWSLMGVELSEAVINDQTYKHQITNEGGVSGTIRLLKNIMGLWLVQECRREWKRQGQDLDYTQLTQMAREAKPFAARLDTNDQSFFAPGDMPEKVNAYLKASGQETTDDKGQIVRIILESLAMRYRWVLEKLEEVTGRRIDVLHMVGGGIKNELLCQFTANAIGREVIAGPVEATASGNVIVQAMASGQIESLEEGRAVLKKSYDEMKSYQPQDAKVWDEQYRQFEMTE